MPSTEAPISINLKSAGGTGITLRGETAEQFADMIANGIHIIADAVKEVETAIRGASPAMSTQAIAAALGGSIIETGTTIPAQEYTPSIGGRNCPHGRMTAIQGMGKDGKPYKGYFCPAPKGAFDKCKNQYVLVTNPEWNTFVPDTVK